MNKEMDEMIWDEYTPRYARSAELMNREHDIVINNFSVANDNIIFSPKNKSHPIWKEIYHQIVSKKAKSVFEIGCGSGIILNNISDINPEIKIAGCDLLKSQIEFGKNRFDIKERVSDGIKVLDFSKPLKGAIKKYDFVFTSAVITHLSVKKAKGLIENAIKISNKYVLFVERPEDKDDIIEIIGDTKIKGLTVSMTNKYINIGVLVTHENI